MFEIEQIAIWMKLIFLNSSSESELVYCDGTFQK